MLITALAETSTHYHNPPIQHDVEWWIIATVIICGGALLSSGIDQTVKRWLKKRWVRPQVLMFSEILSAVLAAGGGAIVGMQVWDMWLGAMCGLLGGFASTFFLNKTDFLFKVWASRFGTQRIVVPPDKKETKELPPKDK